MRVNKMVTDFAKYMKIEFDPSDIVEFRLIRKGHIEKHWAYARDCLAHESYLHKLNQQGWNIYVGVNPRIELKKSGDANVKLARWVFADFDHIEPSDGCTKWESVSERINRAGLDMPDMVVSSGNGIHTYWKLSEPLIDMPRWRDIQEKLINTLDSDPVIKNPERIMRVPGFKNMKDMEHPKDCFIIMETTHD